ncbi:hypothetical protein D3C72_1756520 [compost metagenome]
MAVPAASSTLVWNTEILADTALLSKMLMLAGVLFTVTFELLVLTKVTTTVSVPSTTASLTTGIVMVPVV